MKDFQAQVFCLTGVIPEFSRTDIFDHIAARDGEYVERMTKGVTILVVGERGEGTTKYKKALQYGTETMPYEDFMAWLFCTPVVDSNAHLRDLSQGSSSRHLCGAHVTPPNDADASRNDDAASRNDDITISRNNEGKKGGSSFTKLIPFLRAAAAVLIIIMRSLVVLSAVCLCICLWCIGIPAKP